MFRNIICFAIGLSSFASPMAYSSTMNSSDLTGAIPLITRGKVILLGLKDYPSNTSGVESVLVYRSDSLEIIPKGSLFAVNAIFSAEGVQLKREAIGSHELAATLLILYSGLDETLIDRHYFASRLSEAPADRGQILELEQVCSLPSIDANGTRWESQFCTIREAMGESPVYRLVFYGSVHPFRIDGCKVEFLRAVTLSQPPPR